MDLNKGIVAGQCFKLIVTKNPFRTLFFAETKGIPVNFEISSETFSANPSKVFSPVPTAVPP